MRLKLLSADLIEIPFRKKCLNVLVCILILLVSSTAYALPDVQEADSKAARKLVKKAEKLIRNNEFQEAETILFSVLKSHPEMADAKLNIARIYLKYQKYIEAYNIAFDVAEKDSENAFAFAILGGSLLGVGNFKDARTSFNNALILDKKEAFAWAGLGMLDYYENHFEESIYKLKNSIYLQPREPDYVFALAQVSARSERYREAADSYRRFLHISSAKDVERRERIKGLIDFLTYLGNRTSLYSVGGEKETTVPFDLIGNRPVIELKFEKNGEPLKFVLDTGSGISVISEETAEKLGIKSIARGGKARAIGGDGKFDIVYGFVNSIYIGDVKVRNVPIYIRKFHNTTNKADGYIGISLISKFLTTIDYGNLTFSLERKDDESRDKFANETEGMVLPLRLTSSGFLSGTVQLDGIESPLNFIVDTGASITVISDELANTNEMSQYEREEKMRVIGAAGITENVSTFSLPRVTFGDYSRDELTAVALDLDIINEATGFQQTGILGGNFLKNYRLTFDFQNSKLIFVPNKK